jgi:multidrug efflux system membrane fusion protein
MADMKRRVSKGRVRLGLAVVAIAVVSFALFGWFHSRPTTRSAGPPPPVPVTVTQAEQRDVPIFLNALGTVGAFNTVSVRSQIDGTLQSVNFVEGQEVKAGDVLAEIDPRTQQAALTQAIAKKAQDQAQLIDAQKDLARFKTLATRAFETQQNVDKQQAMVDQLIATIQADQGAIEAAQTQLSYTKITAPLDGRVGFRQVDAGNIVHASDQTPLTVITQVRPIVATFTLPQKELGPVREAMLRGDVNVLAFDQDNQHQLAQGALMLIDNQIDQATSTIRLKARFPNQDERLWPGEFVRIRTQVALRNKAVTVPPPALQRGPQGVYVWVINPDNTAEQRPVDANQVSDDTVIVNKGLAAGERVVIDGQYRVQPGTRVAAKMQNTTVAEVNPQSAQQ